MKKAKYIISLLTLLLLFPYTTYADDDNDEEEPEPNICSNEIYEQFKQVEDDYYYKYEYDINNETYTFTFHRTDPNYIYGLSSKLEVNINCWKENDTDSICTNAIPGEYNVRIISKNDNCIIAGHNEILNLKKHNKYYADPLCEGIEEFVLCQETYDKEIDYDTFVSRVETYKRTKEETSITPSKNKNNVLENTLKYVKDNLFQIIIIVTFIIAATITVIVTVKSAKKSRRLE